MKMDEMELKLYQFIPYAQKGKLQKLFIFVIWQHGPIVSSSSPFLRRTRTQRESTSNHIFSAFQPRLCWYCFTCNGNFRRCLTLILLKPPYTGSHTYPYLRSSTQIHIFTQIHAFHTHTHLLYNLQLHF